MSTISKFLDQQLEAGNHVIFADDDHASALQRKVVGSLDVLGVLASHHTTLVLEGPQKWNKKLTDFRFELERYEKGQVTKDTLLENPFIKTLYHLNDPDAALERSKATFSMYDNAYHAGVTIFFPEKDSAAYAALDNAPVGQLFKEETGYISRKDCSNLQINIYDFSLDDAQRKQMSDFNNLLTLERQGTSANQAIIDQLSGITPPYVLLYGNNHTPILKEALGPNTVAIGMLASSRDRFWIDAQHVPPVPDYMYYADTEEIADLRTPEAKAKFLAEHVRPLNEAEVQTCVDEMPAAIVQRAMDNYNRKNAANTASQAPSK